MLSLFGMGALYAACHQANSWRYNPTGDLQFPASPGGDLWPHHQRKFWHASCPSHQIAVETFWDSSLHMTKINPCLTDVWGRGWARNIKAQLSLSSSLHPSSKPFAKSWWDYFWFRGIIKMTLLTVQICLRIKWWMRRVERVLAMKSSNLDTVIARCWPLQSHYVKH